MTSTTTTNEETRIERERKISAEIEARKTELTQSRKVRRSLAIEGDAKSVAKAQHACDEARAKASRLEDELRAAKGRTSSLGVRLDDGDETVSVDDVVNAEKATERAERLLKPAKRDLRDAERGLAPMIADQFLANLAADVLEEVTDVPVIVRRKVDNAPDVSPALILSQLAGTENYGSLEASGVVQVTAVGEPWIDWTSVARAFEDAGCKGRFTSKRLTFDVAAWPLPRLTTPARHGLAAWMVTFSEAWGLQVSGAAEVDRMRERGFNAPATSIWGGLFDRPTTDLKFEDGKAIGTSSVRVAAQQDNGTSMELEALEAELSELVDTFREETIGGITEAGEIVAVSLGEVSRARPDWGTGEVTWRMGGPVQPNTAEATITVEFAYEQA